MNGVRTEVLEQRRVVVGRWFREHGPALERYAIRRVGRERSGEVVSDVFAAVLTSPSALPPEGEALPWLYAFARYKVLELQAMLGRQSRLSTKLQANEVARHVTDTASSLTSQAWVETVLNRLPADDAELLRLVVWEDLDTAAASKVLGISPGAARVRLHRIRRRVQRHLADSDDNWSTR